MKDFVVSLHDVAPSKAELCRRWIDILNARGIRTTLLVVPGEWNGRSLSSSPSFISWLHEVNSQGHEVALHGLQHSNNFSGPTRFGRRLVGGILARGCEEFWHLPHEEAFLRIKRGREILLDEGFSPTGFVAPGWLMSPGTHTALQEHQFNYTVTHSRLIDVKDQRKLLMPTVSQRPQSLSAKPVALANEKVINVLLSQQRSVRIAIHPNDNVSPRLRQSNINMIDSLIGAGYKDVTYHEKWSSFVDSVAPKNVGSHR